MTNTPDDLTRPERDHLQPPMSFGYGVHDQTDHVDAVATMLLRRFVAGLVSGTHSLDGILDIEVVHMPECTKHDERNGACNCLRAIALRKVEVDGDH